LSLVLCCRCTGERVWVHFNEKCGGGGVALDTRAVLRRSTRGTQRAAADSALRWEDMSVCPAHVAAAVEATGGRVVGTSRWLNAASIELPSGATTAAARLATLPFVRSVQPVTKYRRSPDGPGDAGSRTKTVQQQQQSTRGYDYGASFNQLSSIGAVAAHMAGHNGNGVRVLVLDSGFLLTHPALATAKVVETKDFVGDGRGSEPLATAHGTSTASCIAGYAPGTLVGVAPGAELLLGRTEDVYSEYQGEEDFFVFGLEWGESLGADIASASLGYSDWYTFDNMTGTSAISRACDTAFALGMLVVVSAGNMGIYGISAPADAQTVLAVGAVTSAGTWAPFSSVGPTADMRIKPDVSALGASVWVAKVSSTYGLASGTSFSCPLVAGVCALVLSAHPDWSPRMLREAVVFTASNASSPDLRVGFGVVDAVAAIAYNSVPGADCDSFGCINGTCVAGKCVCATGFYGTRCEFSKGSQVPFGLLRPSPDMHLFNFANTHSEMRRLLQSKCSRMHERRQVSLPQR